MEKEDTIIAGNTDNTFALLQKVFDMMEYGYGALKQFPKSERYGLTTDIKHVMDTMLEHCIEARLRYYKKTTLQELDVANAKLKAYLRLSCQLHYLPTEKYGIWADKVVEIGKMIGGWLNTVKSQSKS